MTISPNTGTLIMGFFLLLGIAGQTPLPVWVNAMVAMDIQSTCAYLAVLGNGVGMGLHLMSSAMPGPLAAPPTMKQAQEIMKSAQEAVK